MTNFALIENGTVANIVAVPDDQAHRGAEYMADDLGLGGLWVEAGDAGIGWLYENGELVPPVDPDPESQYKTQFSALEFRDRFTINEQIAIRQAQFDDMEVGLVYDSFQAAQFIDLEDPRVEQGIDIYIAKGLLAPERKAQLLEPELIE